MTVGQVVRVLDAVVLTGPGDEERDMETAISSDSMSDVLSFSSSGSLLLTGLTNLQSVRTAEMADLGAICYVLGKRPAPETLAQARAQSLPLLSTPLGMYESCGRLYAAGMKGGDHRA